MMGNKNELNFDALVKGIVSTTHRSGFNQTKVLPPLIEAHSNPSSFYKKLDLFA